MVGTVYCVVVDYLDLWRTIYVLYFETYIYSKTYTRHTHHYHIWQMITSILTVKSETQISTPRHSPTRWPTGVANGFPPPNALTLKNDDMTPVTSYLAGTDHSRYMLGLD